LSDLNILIVQITIEDENRRLGTFQRANFIDVFNATKNEIETKVKAEFVKVPNPKLGGDGTVTKADFNKMGYAEKLKFKQSNPDLYKEFIK
jgi:hypothetical protein